LAELVAATSISERNRLEWCRRDLIPKPLSVSLGRKGSASYYRVETVPMIRRVYELQQHSRNLDGWRWQLWLDRWLPDVPDIRAWAIERLDADLAPATAAGPSGIAAAVTRAAKAKPRPSDPGRALFNRVPKLAERETLLSWVTAGFAGHAQQASLQTAEPPIFAIALKAMGLSRSELPAPSVGIESMSVAWYREILATASGDDLEQARRDWQCVERLIGYLANADWNACGVQLESTIETITKSEPEPPSKRDRKARRQRPLARPAIADLFLQGLRDFKSRPYLLALFIGLRRSSLHNSKTCTEALALAESFLSQLPRLKDPKPLASVCP
jgi:hypothetical protein